MQLTAVVAPCKFLLCALQFILAIVIIRTREDYIYSGISSEATSDSSDYSNAEKGYGRESMG